MLYNINWNLVVLRMEKYQEYLKEKYQPLALITYGSFQCGTKDEYSDFDCMIIVEEKTAKHDSMVIDGIPLDCFIFTRAEVTREELDAFLAVYDGNIIYDTDDLAADLKRRVRTYVAENSVLPKEEKTFITEWIQKTMHRVEKNDDEGNYRALAFLWESITDYFLLRDMFYFGSKKAVTYLKEHDIAGYRLYHEAITKRTNAAIKKWAKHITNI